MNCSSIPAGMEVRGVLDLGLAVDEHTPWIDGTKLNQDVFSPYSFWGVSADSRTETRWK